MNEPIQGSNPDVSVPVKRKRGRPRKYPKPDLDQGGNVHVPRDQNLNSGENSRAPAGFGGVNGNQPHQVDPVNDANDVVVGQVVNGVIEATFDAGYLLSVRVGNSETTLRGIVFKPGRYVPVSADNDIAPGIQMIRRNEIPFPRENYAQVHGHNPRSRDRNGTPHTARSSNPGASKGKQVPSTGTQTSSPGISRGNLVPVVFHPVNVSNGVPAAVEASVASQASHPMPSKGKQVLDVAHPSNGSTPTNQVLHSQSQNNHQVISSGAQSEAGPVSQNPAEALQEAEAKSMKMPNLPFEKLLTEVVKRIQVTSHSTETNSSSAVKLSVKGSGLTAEDDANDTDQPLSIEPLQSLQPDLRSQPAVVSRPLENYRTGKMTELLKVNNSSTSNASFESSIMLKCSLPMCKHNDL